MADYAADAFTHDSAAMLDLATCTKPAGQPCEDPAIRPANAPVCPFMSEGGLAFLTLRGGGLLVADVRATPMRIVAEYDAATVKGNGCGGRDVNGHMYVNAGGRPCVQEHMELYGFDVYRFPLARMDDRARPLPAGTPEPEILWTSEGAHDSHGMVATPESSGSRTCIRGWIGRTRTPYHPPARSTGMGKAEPHDRPTAYELGSTSRTCRFSLTTRTAPASGSIPWPWLSAQRCVNSAPKSTSRPE